MARTAAQDDYAGLHEKLQWHDGTFTAWASKRTPAYPFHRDAGVSIHVAEHDLTPWDDFTTDPDASPVRPEEVPADDPDGGA